MGLTIVVLGMHRSGTSCITNILSSAGMYLGPNLLNDPIPENLAGHGEAWEAIHINDRLLRLSGGSWDQVPRALTSDAETSSRIRAFLQQLGMRSVAGWKDPRTTITLPLWKQHLTNYRIVACLRHPLSVARSLQVREKWPLEKGLDLWTTYNERLIQHLDDEEQEVFWFDFDAEEGELTKKAQELCEALGLETDSSGKHIFNPYLRHQSQPGPIQDSHVRALYEKLRERAARHGRHLSNGCGGPTGKVASSIGREKQAMKELFGETDQVAIAQTGTEESLAIPLGTLRRLLHPQGEVLVSRAEFDNRLEQVGESAKALDVRLTQLARVQQLQNECQQGLKQGQATLEEAYHRWDRDLPPHLERIRQGLNQQLAQGQLNLQTQVESQGRDFQQQVKSQGEQSREEMAQLKEGLHQELAKGQQELAQLRQELAQGQQVLAQIRLQSEHELAQVFVEIRGYHAAIDSLSAELAALKGHQQSLVSEIEQCKGFVSRLRGMFIFQFRRAIARRIKTWRAKLRSGLTLRIAGKPEGGSTLIAARWRVSSNLPERRNGSLK